MAKNRPWLTRNLKTLSWVSLLQDAASEMLYPILPVFLNTILGAPAAIVGAIEGAAEGAAALTKLASNWLNRYLPRRTMVLLGYAGAALGKVIVALAGIWPVVLIGRVVDRLGKGMRSAARDALLVVDVEKHHRGKVIGFHRTADTTGAVVGPLLALGLLSIFDNNIRPVLWCAVVPGVLSTILVLLVRDREPAKGKPVKLDINPLDVPSGKTSPTVKPRIAAGERKLVVAIALIVAFGFVNFPDALLLLHVSQVGFTLTEVIGAYLLYNVSYAALSFPAGMLGDRFKPQHIYAIGLLCFAATYGGMALTSDQMTTLALLAVYGGFAAANDTVGKSWISKLAPDHLQLWAQSRLQGFSNIAVLVAGVWAGLLWTLGPDKGVVPLAISGVVALVGALTFARFKA